MDNKEKGTEKVTEGSDNKDTSNNTEKPKKGKRLHRVIKKKN